MTLLVVGASHHTCDVSMLERLAVAPESVPDLLAQLLRRDHVTEAVVLSTCNRVEIYAGVSAFHGGLTDVSHVLAERLGTDPHQLASHLYVRWDAEAVTHTLRVAAGLDSMVVGEAQILGQLRAAYTAATEADAVGSLLHELVQQALRVGKRAQAETELGAAGRSMVSAALELATSCLRGPLAQRAALVIGAGSMGALAVSGLARVGAGPVYVANRGAQRAARLARDYDATAVDLADVADILPRVDLVVSATASAAPVLTTDLLRDALAARSHPAGPARPVVICDLAVPRDVEPGAAQLPGLELIDPDRLAAHVTGPAADAVVAAEQIVRAEAEELRAALRGADVAPTVAALRSRADEIVATELARLARRRPDLSDDQRAEVAHTVHRLVQRLLHQPTVKVRQLAAGPHGATYAALLAELFNLQVPQPDRADRVPEINADRSDGEVAA